MFISENYLTVPYALNWTHFGKKSEKHPNLLSIGRLPHFHSPEGAYNFAPLKPGRRDCWALRVTIKDAGNSFIFFNFLCWGKEWRTRLYAEMEKRVRHQVDQLELDNIHNLYQRSRHEFDLWEENEFLHWTWAFYYSGLVVNCEFSSDLVGCRLLLFDIFEQFFDSWSN